MAATELDGIFWQEIPTPDRGMQWACSLKDAEIYTGLSRGGLSLVLDKHQIRRYTPGHGRTKYVARVDLDYINRLRNEVRVDAVRVSSGELLDLAAALFQRIQSSHEGQEEAEVIALWLEQYRQYKEA